MEKQNGTDRLWMHPMRKPFPQVEAQSHRQHKAVEPDLSALVQSHSKYANAVFRWHRQVYFWQFRSECQRDEVYPAWRVDIVPYRGGSHDRLVERTPCKETGHNM